MLAWFSSLENADLTHYLIPENTIHCYYEYVNVNFCSYPARHGYAQWLLNNKEEVRLEQNNLQWRSFQKNIVK